MSSNAPISLHCFMQLMKAKRGNLNKDAYPWRRIGVGHPTGTISICDCAGIGSVETGFWIPNFHTNFAILVNSFTIRNHPFGWVSLCYEEQNKNNIFSELKSIVSTESNPANSQIDSGPRKLRENRAPRVSQFVSVQVAQRQCKQVVRPSELKFPTTLQYTK